MGLRCLLMSKRDLRFSASVRRGFGGVVSCFSGHNSIFFSKHKLSLFLSFFFVLLSYSHIFPSFPSLLSLPPFYSHGNNPTVATCLVMEDKGRVLGLGLNLLLLCSIRLPSNYPPPPSPLSLIQSCFSQTDDNSGRPSDVYAEPPSP